MRSKERERLLNNTALVETNFRILRVVIHSKVDRNQTSLDGKTISSKDLDSEVVSLLLSEKHLKREMQLRSEHSKEEYLRYQLDSAVAKKRRAHKTIESLWEQLLSVRSDIDSCSQRLLFYIKRFTADVTDGFSGIFYCLSTEVKTLVEKQRKEFLWKRTLKQLMQ